MNDTYFSPIKSRLYTKRSQLFRTADDNKTFLKPPTSFRSARAVVVYSNVE